MRVLSLATLLVLAAAPSPSRGLEIYWIDVEGGAATLLVTPNGESILVDSGWPEERDVQRDKDMAWSGLAQAALDSVGLVQLNTENTLEGFVALVVKATDLLLQARDKRNS